MLILVINPGSTSTKISLFNDRKELFTESIFHDAPVLLAYKTTNDQLPMRREVIESFLKKHSYTLKDIDLFIGRGGCAYSQPSGVMEIDERLYADTKEDKGGSDHPAKLGVMLAFEFSKEFGKKAYTVDPTNVDELDDLARITGIKGVYKRAQSHVLNQKGIAREHAERIGKNYEDCSFIVCHIDGGITISAHKNGRMIDGTEGAGGDGPFTPTRLGSIPIMETAIYSETHEKGELEAMCSRKGGFVSHFGTSNSDKVHSLVEAGDEHANIVWKAMIYQIEKEIGAMAAVLKGKVDAILLTGGLVRFKDITESIEKDSAWIAPVFVYPGEVEQEALCYSTLDALEGKRPLNKYTGEPVFKGFDWDVL